MKKTLKSKAQAAAFAAVAAVMLCVAALLVQPAAEACTGLQVTTKDGVPISGRTLEFGVFLDTSIVFVPRGYEFSGQTSLGTGKTWKSRYASVGVIIADNEVILDGINEKGLSVGNFYFPGYAGYSVTTPENRSISMSSSDITQWIVSQFATVAEVRAAIENNEVAISTLPTPGFPPQIQPFHFVVYDKSGKSLVIEPMDGKLKLFDNPLGVMANSPTFDWHMTNLRNYVALDPRNAAPVKVSGKTFSQLGLGSGMLGLPGDFTPPSRFVRASVMGATALPQENAEEGVFQVFHLLNNFDIPLGIARSEEDGVIHSDSTLLTVVRDPQHLRFYYRTYDDQTIRMVDLSKFDLDAKAIKRISTKSKQPVVDMSDKLK